MQFDQDDLEDYQNYSQEEEDTLTEEFLDEEEYSTMCKSLVVLKKELESYNNKIPEYDLKEALYENYYSIEEAVKELKGKFPKKKEPVRSSKLFALANSRASAMQASNNSAVSTMSTNGKPKLSKLAMLAKSRQSADQLSNKSSNVNKSLSILNSISRKTDPKSESTIIDKTTPVDSLLNHSNNLKNTSNSTLPTKPIRKRELPQKKRIFKDHKSINDKLNKSSDRGSNIPVVLDDSNLLKLANASKISAFLFSDEHADTFETNKRRRLDLREIFEPITNAIAKKAAKNFNEKSPDATILDAQKSAFEANMNSLSIKDTTPKTTKPFKNVDISKVLTTTHKKPHKSFVVIGHVDSGKSTILGRLLYDVGAVDANTLNKLTKEAERSGKGSFALAWIMDQTSEERSRGVTIDIVATNFETANTRYTAIDAPGHKDFVPQMINGVTQANYALIVVDGVSGEFEVGLSDGLTKEHTLLAKSLGIGKVCVVVNKMDRENWSQDRFHEIETEMTQYLTKEVGFDKSQIDFIPISGLTGNNLVKRDNTIKEFEWYTGPTVIEHLDSLDGGDDAQIDNQDFLLVVNDIYEPTSAEVQLSGKVFAGTLQPGQTIQVCRSQEFLQVQSIYVNDKPANITFSGELASLKFKASQLARKSPIMKGDVVIPVSGKLVSCDKFQVEVTLFEMDKPLLVGTPFVLFKNNTHFSAYISQIISINGKKKKKMHLVSKQTALVEITCDRSLPVTTYVQNSTLGRMVLRREGKTIGAGKVTEL